MSIDTAAPRPSIGRIAYVDGIRAIASIAVLLQHLLEKVDADFFGPALSLGPGVFGVALFFFVSGYVIPMSVRNNPTLGVFLLRRWFRIYPAYLVAMIVAMAAGAAFGWRPLGSYGLFELLVNAALIAEYTGEPFILGVAWTLPLEFAWYGIFAVLFFRFGDRRGTEMALVFFGFVAACVLASAVVGVRFPTGRASMIGAAFIGYLAWKAESGDVEWRRFWQAAAVFGGTTAAANVVSYGLMQHPNITLFNALSAWVAATAIFLVLIAFPTLKSNALVASRPSAWLGRVSYSLYLFHGPVILVAAHFELGYFSLVVVPVVSLGMSAIGYRWIEKPAIASGRSLERWAAGSIPARFALGSDAARRSHGSGPTVESAP